MKVGPGLWITVHRLGGDVRIDVVVQPDPFVDGDGRRLGSSTSPTRAWQQWWQACSETEDVLLAAASRQGFVLTSAQVAALGVSRSTTRTRVRRGSWSAPAVGVIAPFDVDDGAERFVIRRRRHALLTAACALRNPGLASTARSAAVLHGLPTMRLPEKAELVSAATRGLGGRAPTHRYRAGLDPAELDDWFGVRTTTVSRTVLDLARHSRWDGLMAADAALHEGLTTRHELELALAAARGWPGVVKARGVVGLADARAESPLESITRLRIHDAGLPAPDPQFLIGGYRVDLCWPDQRLVLEADELAKYSDDALHAEKRRERHLRSYGYRVERVTWDEVTRRWSSTLRWLSAALAA